MSDDILSLTPPPADKRIAYGADANQFFDLRLPTQRQSNALVMNIHGGFWRSKYSLDHAGHLCAALTHKGLITANLEYRRVGNEGGGWPGTFADIRSAYNFLAQHGAQYGGDPKKIIVMGHSAGGQLALCLAAHQPALPAAVSLAGVVNLRRAYELHLSNNAVVEFLGGTPSEVPDHYREADPMQLHISHTRQWLVHGEADDTVPFEFSQNYVNSKQKLSPADKEDVHLLSIRNSSHFDLIDPRTEAGKQVLETVLKLAA